MASTPPSAVETFSLTPVSDEGPNFPPGTLVTDSSKTDAHFIYEAAIALYAADCLLCHDSASAENAVAHARKLFDGLDTDPTWGNGRHEGDCTKVPFTCCRCLVEDYIHRARTEHEP